MPTDLSPDLREDHPRIADLTRAVMERIRACTPGARLADVPTLFAFGPIYSALLAAERRGAQQWQRIETAPKDETRVLLFNPDEFIGSWAVQSGAWYFQLGGWQYDGQTPAYSNAHPPTHWMPLPVPPSSADPPPAQEPGVESTKGAEAGFWGRAAFEAEKRKNAEAERDALKVKRDVALRAWKGAAADRDKAQRQVAELKAEVASLKVENERLQHDNEQLATEANDNAHAAAAQAQRGRELRAEVESLKVANLRWQEIADGMNREVESLKAKLAALSAGEQSAEATRTALEADLAEFKEVAAFETAEALKYEAQLNALEGALKAKAEEWRKRADYCEQVGLQPQAVMLRQHAAELDALLSAPASAGSAGQETSSPQEPR
jgi:hypothetical protein